MDKLYGLSLKDNLMEFLVMILETLETWTPKKRKQFIKDLKRKSFRQEPKH